MHPGEQAPCEQEGRVAGDSFVQQARGLGQLLPGVDVTRSVGIERLSAQVDVVGGKIGCGAFSIAAFSPGELGLKLVGDRRGDLRFE
jgi:hypothetical protein